MYYDASGTDYISTSSFAIPNTGILTIEAWMKSQKKTTTQEITSDGSLSNTVGYIRMYRYANTYSLYYEYSNGLTISNIPSINYFLNLDSQYIHIVVVCDYTNKKGYVYRNGVQFGSTLNLLGTPQFPSVNRVKYIGAYNAVPGYPLTDGSLDEVRIYNRGLSADEVAAIYNQTKGRY
jgi:hypothetical protein